jgi:uncharacterized damage-inducible protein DinB
MSVDGLVGSWQEVRSGLIDEVESIPADKFTFQATPDTRSVAALLQHVVETQKMLMGEVCRADTNLLRQSFAEQIKVYAPEVAGISDKDGLLSLLRSSMEETGAKLLAAGDDLGNEVKRFDGKPVAKYDLVSFVIAHEMYHRGQLTVYLRLLGIEPVLTKRFRKRFGDPQKAGD